MCKYSDDTGYECPHKRLEDSDYCIFHLQDDNKDVDEFNNGIKYILGAQEDAISLRGFYFPPESSDFSSHIFRKKIDFDYVTFSGDADFGESLFFGDAAFRNAKFLGGASFHLAEILGGSYFYNTVFSRYASFLDAVFSGYTSFTDAVFSGDVNFNNVTFSGNTNIQNAVFSGDANFKGAKFSDYAHFRNAMFSRRANFVDTIFSDEVDFTKIKFLGFANFLMTKFRGDADFTIAKFSDATSFKDAVFSGYANFTFVIFLGNVLFEDTIFLGNTIFQYAELARNFKIIPDKSDTINFNNTHFSDNVRIKADLSKCSFANSNVERVDMTDSTWIVDNKPKDSYKIWEQRQGELSSNWKELEGIYRRLKQSYQRFGDNDTAGNFYYHEMECKRQQLKSAKKLFWGVFYKLLCGYGEKPFNVIWASISIIFVASLFFFYWGIELLGSEVLNLTPRLINYDLSLNFQWVMTNIDAVFNDWLECLYTSVITFTTLGYGDVHPIGFSRIVASVEAGIGIIMTALFIFVFTRKMLR